jgi:dUTP pyrophosphatase
MKVKVKKLDPRAVVPTYANLGDAGLDLTAITMEIKDGRIVYGTGLAIEIPEGFVGLIFPRSSICKKDLRLTNSVGVIDSGYRGEIKFFFEAKITPVKVLGDKWDTHGNLYEIGERVGQLVIMPYPQIELEESEELSDTARGSGGFGSSGA